VGDLRLSHGGNQCRRARLRLMVRAAGCLLVLAATLAQGAPPRVIDEEDDSFQPANFAQVDSPELPRAISPRNSSHDTPGKPITAGKSSTNPVSLWGTVIGLGAVFGLFLGVRVWLTRNGPTGMRGLPIEALELLGKRTIEPRVSIHIVRCGPKILILGVSPDGIRTLTEITDPTEIDLLAGACKRKEAGAASTANFAGMFRQTNSSTNASSRGGV